MKRIIGAVGAALLLGACGMGTVSDGNPTGTSASAEGSGGGGGGPGDHHEDAGTEGTGDHHEDGGTGGGTTHFCSDDITQTSCEADALGCRWLTGAEARCQSLNDPAPDAGSGEGSGGGSEPDAGPRK